MLEPIIDSHAHLFYPEYGEEVEAVVARAGQAGVEAIVNIGTQPATNPAVVEQTHVLNAHGGPEAPQIYAALGFHPHEAQLVQPEDWAGIERLAAAPEVVGLGEFGLDYHYELSPRQVQREVFRGGIRLSLRTGLPLVIHSREAGLEAIEILDEVAGGAMPRGVFHCFTDTWDLAAAALERGFYIGITGIVTYPNSENVREVARRIPLERLLVETDAPFCTPDPLRTERRKLRKKGKEEPNEPAFVVHVAAKLAELHGVEVTEVRRRTTDNARTLFGL
jgi:TatD DNase family protein